VEQIKEEDNVKVVRMNIREMLSMEKQYRDNNKKLLASIKKKYNDRTMKKRSEYGKLYKKKNRKYINKKIMEKRKTSVNFRVKENLRSRLYQAIKNGQKSGSAVKDLGCTIKELKQHLEQNFHQRTKTGEKMSWKNYGIDGWHIDHIKPLSSFNLTDRKQFLEACHYTNLQPLWAEDNLRKGVR
jgi:cell division ATPase FtsA